MWSSNSIHWTPHATSFSVKHFNAGSQRSHRSVIHDATSCYQTYLCHSYPAQSNATLAERTLSLRPPQPTAASSLKSSFLLFMSSRNTYSACWFPAQRPKLTSWRQGLASPYHFPALCPCIVSLPGSQLTSAYGSTLNFTPTVATFNPFLTLQVFQSGEMYNIY